MSVPAREFVASPRRATASAHRSIRTTLRRGATLLMTAALGFQLLGQAMPAAASESAPAAAAAPTNADPVPPQIAISLDNAVSDGVYSGFNTSPTSPNPQDLTAVGATDWRIWGTTSTSLAGDAGMSGGAGISGLTNIEGGTPISLRALGPLGLGVGNGPSTIPFSFSWSNGAPVASGAAVGGGLQHNNSSSSLVPGYGFSFTVPTSTTPQRLTVWASAHHGTGRLRATIGSATYTDTGISGGQNHGGIYTIVFTGSGAANETMQVSYVLDAAVNPTSTLDSDGQPSTEANVVVYAAALSTNSITLVSGAGTGGALSADPNVTFTIPATDSLPAGTPGSAVIMPSNAYPVAGAYAAPIGGSRWVNTNGAACDAACNRTAIYSIPFTLPTGYTNPTITVQLLADNEGTAYLNDTNTLIGAQPSSGSGTITDNFLTILSWTYNTAAGFHAGTNTLLIKNVDFGGADGIDFKAVVTYGLQASPPAAPAAAPILVIAASGINGGIAGRLQANPGLTSQTVSFYLTPTCSANVPGATQLLGHADVALDANGAGTFAINIAGLPSGQFVTATAIDATHAVSGFANCIQVGASNDSWPNALDIGATPGDNSFGNLSNTTAPGYALDQSGQSRWYKFSVAPGQLVTVDLTNLPADYDVVLFKDITQAYTTLTQASDLNTLSANFAGQAFSGQAFSAQAFSAQAFSPDAYSAQAFSTLNFSADVFSGQAFSAQAFSGQAFSAQAFSAQAFSGQAFSGQAFSGQAFSAQAFSPQAFSAQAFSTTGYSAQAFSAQAFSAQAFSGQAFSPQAFSSAQVQSVIAVSATTGTGPEAIRANTWNNTGSFYVRVTGKNGVFDPAHPFTLHVTQTSTSCSSVHNIGSAPVASTATGIKTVILTDSSRIVGTDAEKTTLATQLAAFAARPEVAGAVVDVASPTGRIHDLNAQADANPTCPYAKNLLASALKDIVDSYRTLGNPELAYVVLVGGDNTIPFFRYPDEALLAPESGYIPPVLDSSASQASLQLNYVLSQDAYGAGIQINQNANTFPVPDLAVGRLVETAGEATGMLNAYLSTTGGVVAAPTSSLVTGYDFLADAATSVKGSLDTGIGTSGQSLIAPNNISPTDPAAWTATLLKGALLGSRHDLVFLAGHFSANSALAADFSTTVQTTDLQASTVNMTNSIVFSAGCHSGYNLVNQDAVGGITQPLDWAEAFSQKGATLIAGTGYQYGDTDFIMYSERIYSGFAAQLLAGSGPVAVGQALVQAKQAYLRDTPTLRGIDTKALLEATLFGLPMISVNMPNGRTSATADTSVVTTSPITSGPGQPVSSGGLGLQTATLDVSDALNLYQQQFKNPDGSNGPMATWYGSTDGVTTKPFEPTLPLVSKNVTVSGTTLRGVGFWGGTYTDTAGITPLTGAATTDLRGVHTSFSSPVFYPMRLATANYFDALGGGSTRLLITPAQHRSDGAGSPSSTLRLYTGLNLRLFYSNNIETRNVGGVVLTPALAAPPSILDVNATESPVGAINVDTHVIGDPSAGIQEVWVTYTGFDNQWHSVDLQQDSTDSTHWSLPTLIAVPSGHSASEIRFLVQAVNGVGLVGVNDNYGQDYTVTPAVVGTPNTTHVTLGGATSGTYGTVAQVTATLTSATSVANQPITVSLGGSTIFTTTDSTGKATASFQLSSAPATYNLSATFSGDANNLSSTASSSFTINKVGTSITFNGSTSGLVSASPGVVATLTDANGVPVTQRTIYFVVSNAAGVSWTTTSITDYLGRALLGSLPVGQYQVAAYFNGTILLAPSTTSITLTDPVYINSSANQLFTIYQFTGFFQPVSNTVMNLVNAGSAVPIKFSLGLNAGLNILAEAPVLSRFTCDPSDTVTVVSDTVAASTSGLQYDSTSNQYTYVWKTAKTFATYCYAFKLTLVDGSTYLANFKFK